MRAEHLVGKHEARAVLADTSNAHCNCKVQLHFQASSCCNHDEKIAHKQSDRQKDAMHGSDDTPCSLILYHKAPFGRPASVSCQQPKELHASNVGVVVL